MRIGNKFEGWKDDFNKYRSSFLEYVSRLSAEFYVTLTFFRHLHRERESELRRIIVDYYKEAEAHNRDRQELKELHFEARASVYDWNELGRAQSNKDSHIENMVGWTQEDSERVRIELEERRRRKEEEKYEAIEMEIIPQLQEGVGYELTTKLREGNVKRRWWNRLRRKGKKAPLI